MDKNWLHVDTVEYGWWERKRQREPLPDSIKDRRNIVLHAQDLDAYLNALDELRKQIDKEHARARLSFKAMRGEYISVLYERDPELLTLAHVLEFMCSLARAKLKVMELLAALTKKAMEKK